MISSVPIVTHTRSDDPPADWRERILSTLASEGITEPSYVPGWRLFLINFTKLCGLIGLPGGILILLNFFLPDRFAPQVILCLLLSYPLSFLVFSKRLRILVRTAQVELHGRSPSHAVRNARHPPIFYLRAFSFDDEATVTPLKHFIGGRTAEMRLISRMRRYAPVLAIATPNEPDRALGALRFHVTEARWEDVVKTIVPCCRLVVWVTGNTRGLNWEIRHLVASLSPHRLLLWPHANIKTVNTLRQDWAVTAEPRNAEWRQFVDAHVDVFPKPLPHDITDIRFVAFDSDWTPIPVPGARYPARQADAFTDPKGLLAGLTSLLKETFHSA